MLICIPTEIRRLRGIPVRIHRPRGLKIVGDTIRAFVENAVVLREELLGWRVSLCTTGEEDVDEKSGITFVRICPGTFTMGSADDDPLADDDEKPAHRVTLSEYWIASLDPASRPTPA